VCDCAGTCAACVSACVRACVRGVCVCVCVCVCVFVCVCVREYERARMLYLNIRMHARTHANVVLKHTHARTHARCHTHTRTHTSDNERHSLRTCSFFFYVFFVKHRPSTPNATPYARTHLTMSGTLCARAEHAARGFPKGYQMPPTTGMRAPESCCVVCML
jgi:hypothetical protein